MTVTDFGREYRGFKAWMNRVWRPFMVTPEKAAETVVYLALADAVQSVSGGHFVKGRAVRSSPASYDETLAERLWEVSTRLTAGEPWGIR